MKAKCKETRLFFYAVFLLVCIVFVATATLPSLPPSSSGYDVYGDGVDLYLQTNETLGFRHENWTLYLTPTIGNMNATNTLVYFNATQGLVGFLAQEDSSVQVTSDDSNISLVLNGVSLPSASPLLSFTLGSEYVLEWGWQYRIPSIFPVQVNGEYYFRSDVHTVSNVTAYNLQPTSGWSTVYASQNLGTLNGTVDFGFMADLVKNNGSLVSLTGSSPVALLSRVNASEGYQSGLVNVSSVHMNLGLNSLKITLYVRLGSGAWLKAAEYVSDRLMYKGLVASTWNFTFYTKKALSGSDIVASAYWGSQNYKSEVSGLLFLQPLAQEVALFKIQSGDIIGGLLYPYMLLAGNLVYGLGLLFVSCVLYLRHKKWEVILVCMLLFGGSAGIGFLIPDPAFKLVWLVAALVITIVLYRVFR